MAFTSKGKNTFLEIYGEAGATSTSSAAANHPTTSKPRTIASSLLLSGATNSGQHLTSTSDTRYTTKPPRDTMAAFRAIPPPHKNQARAARWPAKHDFPKPDPRRWDTNWDNDWNAEQIVGDKEDEWKSDKNDSWGGGAELTNWDGGFAPPPLDWDHRSAFRPGQSEEQVQRWLDNSETSLAGTSLKRNVSTETRDIDGTTYAFVKSSNSQTNSKPMGDMVPRYWIPTTFGRQDPQTFWEELARSTAPEPHDEGDLHGVRPWWELLSQGQEFLPEPTHPDIAGIDPDESTAERLARENDQGGQKHAENRRNFELAVRQADRQKKERLQERTKKLMTKKCNSSRARNERLRPSISTLFIRSARPDDFNLIRDILNFNVHSGWTSETDELTAQDIRQRYEEAIDSKLPFLVACEKGAVIKARRRKGRPALEEDIVLPDKVLGFALADDYSDMKSMYRYTAQIEIYTDNKYYRHGVANCLMDKMLAMLDPDYLERGGYEVRGEELEGKDPTRLIKNILIHCPFEKSERLEWLSQWFSNWAFSKAGQLDGIGTKLGRAVGLAIFQRATGAQLDHSKPTPI